MNGNSCPEPDKTRREKPEKMHATPDQGQEALEQISQDAVAFGNFFSRCPDLDNRIHIWTTPDFLVRLHELQIIGK